jgi:nucleoside-diphosphate-sugar epimerase
MARQLIGVLGASSLVGDCLLASEFIGSLDFGEEFVAFSRRPIDPAKRARHCVTWHCLSENTLEQDVPSIEHWICLTPIWILPNYYSLLETCGARRLIVLSSTSRFTKTESPDPDERRVVASLISGEKQLISWAEKQGITWIILRPTLIYGFGRDKNISSIARFIRRFGFFPLLGMASGLRQPIHACDVAAACFQALMRSEVADQAYNISGGETLTYNEMVRRVFDAMGRESRFLRIPRFIFRPVISLMRIAPGFRDVSIGMIERMNQDLTFDHSDAERDFRFRPGEFRLQEGDV